MYLKKNKNKNVSDSLCPETKSLALCLQPPSETAVSGMGWRVIEGGANTWLRVWLTGDRDPFLPIEAPFVTSQRAFFPLLDDFICRALSK